MYSVYYKQKEYEVSKRLFMQIVFCMIQFKEAPKADRHLFVNQFKERYVPQILASPPFDYSKLESEVLENVVDTTSITL